MSNDQKSTKDSPAMNHSIKEVPSAKCFSTEDNVKISTNEYTETKLANYKIERKISL